MLEVGSLLADKFRVDRVIGRGGMGVVVAATHLHLQQTVALKFLLPELVGNPQIVERFVREARASARLRGEHVCRVSDVGAFDNGAPYLVMELLDGRDLASLLAAGGPLPVQRAADYVLQACVGIAEAHALGIVHRDLKPANLFLTRRPDGSPLIKVLDFGIAKAQGDRNFSLTQTSTILGSPGYMSPEQLRSTRDVDARSDIWAIGVILYELVSGRQPFSGDSITELALRIAMDPMPPLVGRTPQGFEQLIERCLAKEPAQRHPDLASLAHALAAYGSAGAWDCANAVSRLLTGATQAAAPGAVTQSYGAHGGSPTTMGGAASSMISGPSPARRRGLIAGVAVLAIAGGAVTALVARGGEPPAVAPPTTSAAASPPPPAPAPAPAPAPPVTAAPAPAPAPLPQEPAVPASAPIDAGVDAPRPKPRVPRAKQTETKPEDFGESRF